MPCAEHSPLIGVALITATVVDIVAAKSAAKNHYYFAAPAMGVHLAVPAGMKNLSSELLPQ